MCGRLYISVDASSTDEDEECFDMAWGISIFSPCFFDGFVVVFRIVFVVDVDCASGEAEFAASFWVSLIVWCIYIMNEDKEDYWEEKSVDVDGLD